MGAGLRKPYLTKSSVLRFSAAIFMTTGSTRVSKTIVFLLAIFSSNGSVDGGEMQTVFWPSSETCSVKFFLLDG